MKGARTTTARRRLLEDLSRGPVTLVLGAGVSKSRGVPTWPELVQLLWRRVFFQEYPRAADPRAQHPFELAFALERIQARLAGRGRHLRRIQRELAERASAHTPKVEVELRSRDQEDDLFIRLLREAIYASVQPRRRADTLGVLAHWVRTEISRGPASRLTRILTFNVDDLLEREVQGRRAGEPLLWPIARASHHPRRGPSLSTPIYHLHGFLPGRPMLYREAADTLVFTDLQYWTSVASPMSFANRVVSNALHDSRCVFLGISMSDVNLIRWLGVRAVEIERDKFQQYPDDAELAARATREALDKHYWIRPPDADPTGHVSPLLARRGVRSLAIGGWASSELEDLLESAWTGSAASAGRGATSDWVVRTRR